MIIESPQVFFRGVVVVSSNGTFLVTDTGGGTKLFGTFVVFVGLGIIGCWMSSKALDRRLYLVVDL